MTLAGHTQAVTGAAFSPDGRQVVTVSLDKTARVWSTATGQAVAELTGHADALSSAAFSPDGRLIVTASKDKTARVWDGATHQTVMVLRGHAEPLASAAFSPNGRRVVTVGADNVARIWDLGSGKTVAVLDGHADQVQSTVFSPDGERVLTASFDGTARVWRVYLDTRMLMDDAKGSVGRCLTLDQRNAVSLEVAPPPWSIELDKWPCSSPAWKDWLKYTRANAHPPFPDTPEWEPWIAARLSPRN